MKGFNAISVLVLVALSTVNCKTLDLEAMRPSTEKVPDTLEYEESNIDNVEISEKGPIMQLLSTMEEFVENSVHTIVQDYILRNSTVIENLSQVVSSPLQSFHNFTVRIEDLGDTIFKRQEKIIHLIQCECPDHENKCNHILARKISYAKIDENKRELKEGQPALPIVDVVQLIRHFQQHFSNVLQTQRKVFEYAQCACPNKKECMRSKAAASKEHLYRSVDKEEDRLKDNLQEGVGNNEVKPDSKEVKVRHVRSANDPSQDGKGFFGGFFSWFSNLFGGNPHTYQGSFPNGTQFYNGTLPDGSHYSGGEFHNGNSNGYFVATHKNDANGNHYSSSSSSGSSSSFGKK
uniref:SWIM-type domain-containing protein n=1 Tax=Cacopsylla melanoneura TaxID=428564 RepID=A0A8D8QF41_9HEMI